MSTDIIFIHGLKLQTIIGCLPWEKTMLQTVIIDVDMYTDISAAAASDDIGHSVDYARVAERIKTYLLQARHELVESLAESLAHLLLSEFPLTKILLKINKQGAIADAQAVGVQISRLK